MRTKRASCEGFTLVEMAVVVAIIAILGVLATIAYRRLMSSSRTAEGMAMTQKIKVAQESFFTESGGIAYANISKGLTVNDTYPAKNPGRFKTQWGAPCTWCNLDWSTTLQISTDGPLEFGYATIAGPSGVAPTAGALSLEGTTLNWPAAAQIIEPWYVIVGLGDTDGDGNYCTIMATSWNAVGGKSGAFLVFNEGE